MNVHAFSANSMLGGPPAFQGTPSGPHTPNGDMYAGRLPQLSDLSDQVTLASPPCHLKADIIWWVTAHARQPAPLPLSIPCMLTLSFHLRYAQQAV